MVLAECLGDEPTTIGHHGGVRPPLVVPSLLQQRQRDGVECARGDAVTQTQRPQAPPKLGGRLTGEGEHGDVRGVGRVRQTSVGDTPRENTGLARACAGDDGEQGCGRRDGGPLVAVQTSDEVVELAGGEFSPGVVASHAVIVRRR